MLFFLLWPRILYFAFEQTKIPTALPMTTHMRYRKMVNSQFFSCFCLWYHICCIEISQKVVLDCVESQQGIQAVAWNHQFFNFPMSNHLTSYEWKYPDLHHSHYCSALPHSPATRRFSNFFWIEQQQIHPSPPKSTKNKRFNIAFHAQNITGQWFPKHHITTDTPKRNSLELSIHL